MKILEIDGLELSKFIELSEGSIEFHNCIRINLVNLSKSLTSCVRPSVDKVTLFEQKGKNGLKWASFYTLNSRELARGALKLWLWLPSSSSLPSPTLLLHCMSSSSSSIANETHVSLSHCYCHDVYVPM